jgi:hypothetical protein
MQFEHLHLINNKSYTYENIYDALETDGFPVNILREVASEIASEPITDSHEWIAQLMKFYNLQAAAILGSQGIYRAHKGPVKEKLDSLESLRSTDPSIFQSLTNSAAQYSLHNLEDPSLCTHYGFGGQLYCHATSPIRRYADLHNQRILKKIIQGHPIKSHVDSTLVYKLNEVSKASRNYDRICQFLKEVSIGTPVEGIIISKSSSRLQVYILPWRMTFNLSPTVCEVAEPGSKIFLKYYFDPSKKSWKERMVFNQV